MEDVITPESEEDYHDCDEDPIEDPYLEEMFPMDYDHLAKHKPTPFMPAPPSPTGRFFFLK